MAVENAGFTVCEFTDNPSSFGSWLVVATRGECQLRVTFDGRDSCLSIAAATLRDGWKELKYEIMANRPSNKELSGITTKWLIDAAT